MEFTLAELLMLKPKVAMEVSTIFASLNDHSKKVVRKDTNAQLSPEDNVTFESIMDKLHDYQDAFVEVCDKMAEANSKPNLEWDGKLISCFAAIAKLKEMQKEVSVFNSFKNIKTSSEVYDPRRLYGNTAATAKDYSYERVISANFDTEWASKHKEKLDRQIRKLEVVLNQANYNITVEIDNEILVNM